MLARRGSCVLCVLSFVSIGTARPGRATCRVREPESRPPRGGGAIGTRGKVWSRVRKTLCSGEGRRAQIESSSNRPQSAAAALMGSSSEGCPCCRFCKRSGAVSRVASVRANRARAREVAAQSGVPSGRDDELPAGPNRDCARPRPPAPGSRASLQPLVPLQLLLTHPLSAPARSQKVL